MQCVAGATAPLRVGRPPARAAPRQLGCLPSPARRLATVHGRGGVALQQRRGVQTAVYTTGRCVQEQPTGVIQSAAQPLCTSQAYTDQHSKLPNRQLEQLLRGLPAARLPCALIMPCRFDDCVLCCLARVCTRSFPQLTLTHVPPQATACHRS